MTRLQPLTLVTVYEAAVTKINHFTNGIFQENVDWLQEIQDAARKAFGSVAITLLPKTPSMKRKRPGISRANEAESSSPSQPCSTFVDGGKAKKLKIDDMSAIIESNLTVAENSVLDVTEVSMIRQSKRFKSRRKKVSLPPVKRSKRLAAKTNMSYIESPLEQSMKAKEPILVLETPSPLAKTLAAENSPILICLSSPVANLTMVSPVAHNVHPKVAALIEKLKLTSQRTNMKESDISSQTTETMDEVKAVLFASDEKKDENVITETELTEKKKKCFNSASEDISNSLKDCSVSIESLSHTSTTEVSSKEKQQNNEPVQRNVISDTELYCTPLRVTEAVDVEVKTVKYTSTNGISKQCDSTEEEAIDRDDMSRIDHVTHVPVLEQIKTISYNQATKERKPDANVSDEVKQNLEKLLKNQDCDSGVSSDENIQQGVQMDEYSTSPKECSERHETYKVIVTEKLLPQKSTPQKINTKLYQVYSNVSVGDSPVLAEKYTTVNSSNEVVSKGPRIIKPVKGGNIVSGIKSFIKRPDTPKKETEEEKKMKKAAELERKEVLRQKVMEESHLKKQKMLEMRKKQREERERRFAEQQVRRQEEEEKKRQHLEMKARQISKNREELRKQRELEEKRKREIREMKKAEADARRQKEEDEQKRRALGQIEEEKRRQEMFQRKAEYEEQERQKRKMENDRAEKERLKQIEEERLLSEERKMREFEEKENHRLDVERKLKEERERERLERLQREERLKQAEREIEEAKKHEQERERTKEKLKENIKMTILTEKLARGAQFNGKVIVNAQNTYRTSPKLANKDQENFKTPSTKTTCIKSPAAYNLKKPLSTYNPPCVPLMIRESSYCSYGIDDLNSDDSTDDEGEPAKRVPSWAQGINLKTQLMQQFYTNINPDLIFVNCNEPCRLDKIFQKKKERYFKRTSSAHWSSPILKDYQFK